MTRLETTIFCAILMAGCAGEFSPVLDADTQDETDGNTDPSDEDTGDETSTDAGSTEDTSGTEDTGSDNETEDTETTGEPPAIPGLDDACDPFLAFEGIAPCEDPEIPDLTCAIVRLMPDNDTTTYEFRCRGVSDAQGDGSDLSDNCSDASGQNGMFISTGCLNSYCLWNGLGNDPVNDDPWGHPPGECPFVLPDDMGYSGGCCTMYCDGDHPCDPGWTCQMGAPAVEPIPDGVGACVWL